MVETVSDKPRTLGAMVLLAQKRAKETLARQAAATPSAEDRITDVIQISAEARQRLATARNVSNQLDVFRSFLKFLSKR